MGNYLKKDGSIPLTSDWNIGNKRIQNVLNDSNTQPTDGVNKKYVDDETKKNTTNKYKTIT